MSLKRIIIEQLQDSEYLYHFTTYHFFDKIVSQDRLKAFIPADVQSFPSDYPEELHNVKSVSLTRRDDLTSLGDFRFRLNRKWLSKDYELVPFSDPSLMTDYEEEEVVYEDIHPLSKYCDEIVIYDEPMNRKIIEKLLKTDKLDSFTVEFTDDWKHHSRWFKTLNMIKGRKLNNES